MKVSGFTIIRNAIKFDYPAVEAIQSILPVCDEVIVSVGNSEDDTLQLVRSISSPKIKIVESTWDDTLRKGGQTLAIETDKAFQKISSDSDWAFYIQADEALHEQYISSVKEAMWKWKGDKNVEGILFNYKHFYGSYDYVADSRKWYRKEIRIIKNDKSISSYRDAQGFRKNGRKLRVKPVDAFIYHYGWVKPPRAQQAKQQSFHKMWHSDEWMKQYIVDASEYDYSGIDSLTKFNDSHPAVMRERIAKKNWKFDFELSNKKMTLKNKILYFIEKQFGWRVGEYKNYKQG